MSTAENADKECMLVELAAANTRWLRAHESSLLAEHPGWYGKYLAIATCTHKKVLAVGEYGGASAEALVTHHKELAAQAVIRGVPSTWLVSDAQCGFDEEDWEAYLGFKYVSLDAEHGDRCSAATPMTAGVMQQ